MLDASHFVSKLIHIEMAWRSCNYFYETICCLWYYLDGSPWGVLAAILFYVGHCSVVSNGSLFCVIMLIASSLAENHKTEYQVLGVRFLESQINLFIYVFCCCKKHNWIGRKNLCTERVEGE